MKKIYAGVLMLLGISLASHANPGDTTIVAAHNGVQMPNYGNYDNTVTFPDGNTSYRKIVMEYTLGKYNCGGGYNPANAGEISDGGTGWCSDWDYDVHIIACNATGDTLEMGELITPYANTTYPLFPWTWKHSYFYDVTDFYPVLKDAVTIRVFYSGYSGGFTSTIKFHFIEGTPPRDVVSISQLWHGEFAYGNTANPIASNVVEKTEVFPSNAVSAETKVIISGHGGDDTENCAEFCKKWYQYKINGSLIEQHDIWRDNCNANPISPQSGTWYYQRANWCPGAQVNTIIHKVPPTVIPGQNYTVDMDFQSYTSPDNRASYKLEALMFYYGAYNYTSDAGLESIISPNNSSDFVRENPMCGSPEVSVKNYGGEVINNIEFSYGVTGTTLQTFTWTGNLSPLQSANITLTALPALSTLAGTNNNFEVNIISVNGNADQVSFNNKLTTVFQGVAQWTSPIVISTKPTVPITGYDNTNTWTVYDMDGNSIRTRVCPPTENQAISNDTLNLPIGCYKLEVVNNSGFIGFGNGLIPPQYCGYFKAINLSTGVPYPMPQYDLGNPGLAGNFGNGFTQYFNVSSVTDIKDVRSQYSINIYPNPANNILHIDIYGKINNEANIQLVNILGQTVYNTVSRKQNITIATQQLPNGIYTLIYNTGDSKKMEKVVIAK